MGCPLRPTRGSLTSIVAAFHMPEGMPALEEPPAIEAPGRARLVGPLINSYARLRSGLALAEPNEVA
jgi:hypothetical protein